MEQYTQMIGKNVYTVRGKFGYLIVRKKNSLSVFLLYLFLEEEEQAAKYWIAECNPSIVHLIINDAIYPTDYYITNKKFDWLITENHHDIVKFIGKGLDWCQGSFCYADLSLC